MMLSDKSVLGGKWTENQTPHIDYETLSKITGCSCDKNDNKSL